uniref:Uncharacterized protein n=1 Tax=Anguilla anguilla TaxID=7936 RepID=A0A0E9RAV8_ANGAN
MEQGISIPPVKNKTAFSEICTWCTNR